MWWMWEIIMWGVISAGMSTAWNQMLQIGFIFEKLGIWMEVTLPEYTHKPLGTCKYCNVVWFILLSCLILGPKFILSVGISYLVFDYYYENQ